MNAWRAGLAVCASTGALFLIATMAIRHTGAWIPIVLALTTICAVALFERGRYRSARVHPNATATNETFFDPTTGVPVRVYYDAASGARDYRTDVRTTVAP